MAGRPAPDRFPHLQVASGYSLQYGASPPRDLVARAVEHRMDTLALTDRDGLYGAVRFARACGAAGISPVLGVDLAYRPVLAIDGAPQHERRQQRRTPARGGTHRDLPADRGGLPRVTILATADGPGGGRAGWAALCRLVSATHLGGERGAPVLDPVRLCAGDEASDGLARGVHDGPRLAEAFACGHLMILLGPASELGVLSMRRRDDLAVAAVAPWRSLVPRTHLQVALVTHRRGGTTNGTWGPGTTPHAARMAGLARRLGLGTVLTNAVRHAGRDDAVTVDVLDAARRLVPLDLRHTERGNAEGHLKSGPEMLRMAEEVTRSEGADEPAREAWHLLARTRAVADRCVLDPRRDLGLGEIHLPELRSGSGLTADQQLRARCEAAIGDRYGSGPRQVVWKRLDDELETVAALGYAAYFLTVGDITDLVRDLGVRCAARGSGAGSLVNYLLGVSGVDPVRHQLLMERFLSPRRRALPDIDLDVESARRGEVYDAILDRFGAERCVCVSMMDTYRVRHAVRDVGAALGMAPGDIDVLAKAFPRVRARDARAALRELPELRELRSQGWARERQLTLLLALVERLDGLPRHIAVHPCGVLLSDLTLLDRTPVEASFAGYPMSQFDKDDVEDLGLLKLDVLGIRMQSSIAHALAEVTRVEGVHLELDDEAQVPFDDPATYELISSAHTLGVFQVESPGQRELVGKSGIDSFEEIVADISLFRPGPVASDMITPYLEAKQGWAEATYLHDDLRAILRSTRGVVVYHEQVIEIIACLAGVGFAEADDRRRSLGDVAGLAETRTWFFPRALGRGYDLALIERVWEVLAAFGGFGFCKAHAAAFALTTFQSAWLKAHWPAHFLSGVLTHDPGMYPKRLILDDARRLGVGVLGLDVNASGTTYTVESLDQAAPGDRGIRLALSEVAGISGAEVARVVAARPYASLSDFWHRAQVSRPVVERLVVAGGFDGVYGTGTGADPGLRRRGRVTRRDLLLQVAELDRHGRSLERGARGARGRGRRLLPGAVAQPATQRADQAAARNSTDPRTRDLAPQRGPRVRDGVWGRTTAQRQDTPTPDPVGSVQLALELGDGPREGEVSGLPELTPSESVAAELEVLGLDVSRHVVDDYRALGDLLGVVWSRDLLALPVATRREEILVAGVKVATQTPPLRSGRRVVFVTLDDGTGPVDATFFDDAQASYAATVFGCWALLVRGRVRRTGPRGVSVRASGCWDLRDLQQRWSSAPTADGGLALVRAELASYAQVTPEGDDAPAVARRLWHRSPGSPG